MNRRFTNQISHPASTMLLSTLATEWPATSNNLSSTPSSALRAPSLLGEGNKEEKKLFRRANSGENGLGHFSSYNKLCAHDKQELQKKIYAIFPSIVMPSDLDVRELSSRERAAAQRDHDKELATPRGGMSKKRWAIETARLKDESLKPHTQKLAPTSPTSLSNRSFFRVNYRGGPLHSPDPGRLKAALAMRVARQETLAKHAGNQPHIISSELHGLRQGNVGAAANRYEQLVKYKEFERMSAMSAVRS